MWLCFTTYKCLYVENIQTYPLAPSLVIYALLVLYNLDRGQGVKWLRSISWNRALHNQLWKLAFLLRFLHEMNILISQLSFIYSKNKIYINIHKNANYKVCYNNEYMGKCKNYMMQLLMITNLRIHIWNVFKIKYYKSSYFPNFHDKTGLFSDVLVWDVSNWSEYDQSFSNATAQWLKQMHSSSQ